MVAQPVSRMILFAALPAAAISYVGMPSLYWAHTENGLLCLRSNLPLRPPFYSAAARHVRRLIGIFGEAAGQTVSELCAEFDTALNDAAGPILVRALSASAHGMQSEDAERDLVNQTALYQNSLEHDSLKQASPDRNTQNQAST